MDQTVFGLAGFVLFFLDLGIGRGQSVSRLLLGVRGDLLGLFFRREEHLFDLELHRAFLAEGDEVSEVISMATPATPAMERKSATSFNDICGGDPPSED